MKTLIEYRLEKEKAARQGIALQAHKEAKAFRKKKYELQQEKKKASSRVQ